MLVVAVNTAPHMGLDIVMWHGNMGRTAARSEGCAVIVFRKNGKDCLVSTIMAACCGMIVQSGLEKVLVIGHLVALKFVCFMLLKL